MTVTSLQLNQTSKSNNVLKVQKWMVTQYNHTLLPIILCLILIPVFRQRRWSSLVKVSTETVRKLDLTALSYSLCWEKEPMERCVIVYMYMSDLCEMTPQWQYLQCSDLNMKQNLDTPPNPMENILYINTCVSTDLSIYLILVFLGLTITKLHQLMSFLRFFKLGRSKALRRGRYLPWRSWKRYFGILLGFLMLIFNIFFFCVCVMETHLLCFHSFGPFILFSFCLSLGKNSV